MTCDHGGSAGWALNPDSYNDDYHYYYETSHFTPEVSRLMIDAVLGNGDNGNDELFGMHVTKDNKDILIERFTE